MNGYKPVIGITMGDPAGIGPEIAAKAMAESRIFEICRPLVVGDAEIMRQAVEITETGLEVRALQDVEEALYQPGFLEVLDLSNVDAVGLVRGKVSAMAGKAAFGAVQKVISLAMEKKIDATVTGPLNKEALHLAGYPYSGHTEIYADLTGTRDYSMMLACGRLRVVHVSTHVSLREACDRVKKDRVFRVIGLAGEACRRIGIREPKIGVAGLNPHSGENGLFGREEIEEILPALEQARACGWKAEGPFPPDTLFPRAVGGQFDIVVAMYHDQGHIPLKVLGFHWNEASGSWSSVSGVNITLGLPIIRSSVDHGTAFDQAGKGTATAESLNNAVEYAVRLAENRGETAG